MGEMSRRELERRLRRQYAAERTVAHPKQVEGLVAAMLAEDARMRSAQDRRLGMLAFVAAQVRYIPAWTWTAQAAIVTLMCVVAQMAGTASVTKVVIGILSAATVLVGVPTVQASKLHGVAELEYACPNNAATVLVARLVVLGCSSALAVTLMVAIASAAIDAGAFTVALWACLPFFLSCAGSLALLRHASPQTATMLCVAWVGACLAALLAAGHALPGLYAQASLATWAVASVAALAWLMREVAKTCQAAAAGLDAFSPQLAPTYN